jgi:hypothetical protein
MGIDQFDDLILRTDFLSRHLVQSVGETFQFGLYHGIIHILLAVEIGIERASSLARSKGYIIHRSIGHAVAGKQLPSHIHEFLSGFRDRHVFSPLL